MKKVLKLAAGIGLLFFMNGFASQGPQNDLVYLTITNDSSLICRINGHLYAPRKSVVVTGKLNEGVFVMIILNERVYKTLFKPPILLAGNRFMLNVSHLTRDR